MIGGTLGWVIAGCMALMILTAMYIFRDERREVRRLRAQASAEAREAARGRPLDDDG